MDKDSRKPNLEAYAAEREASAKKLEALYKDKMTVVHHAMRTAESEIKFHKMLFLVDLQGVYLGLFDWLTEHDVPIDDGVVLAAFAQLQLERTAKEIASRVVAAQQPAAYDLKHLLESIEVAYESGKAYLGNELKVATHATYLDVSMKFELFYAPVPLEEIEWRLRGAAKRGSAAAREQLAKIASGVVTRQRVFERDYSAYADFVRNLERSIFHARTEKGFFNYYVGEHGLSTFDEKEVDTRIVVRAMDALHHAEADSLCIVSSDQDFMPVHARADDFRTTSFQVDLSKFTQQDRVGKRIKELDHRFIRCGIDPQWPLQVLTKAMTSTDVGHFAEHNFSRAEWDSLCALHNKLNDVQIELEEGPSGEMSLSMSRPAN